MKNFLLFFLLTAFFISNCVAAYPDDTWWDSDWEYAKIINISENSGNDLTDYPIVIENFSCENECKKDFSDIRVVYNDLDEVKFAMRKNTMGSVNIAFRINATKNDDINNYKIYFGNAQANYKNTSWNDVIYDIYDDFDDNSFNANIWENKSGSQSWVKETNGYLVLHSNHGSDWTSRGKIFTVQNFTNFIAEFDVFDTEVSSFADIVNFEYRSNRSYSRDGGPYNGYHISWWEENNKVNLNRAIDGYENFTQLDSDYVDYTPDNYWTRLKILIYADSHKVYLEDNLIFDEKNHDIMTSGGIGFYCREAGHQYAPFEIAIDNVRIRQYVYPEPTYTIIDAIPPKPPVPQPTDHSLILASPGSDFRNIMSAIPTRLPLLVADSLTPEAEKFINEYNPDYIYTLGLSLDLDNSYEIQYGEVAGLFFPSATQAVYVEDRAKAIFGSNLAYYLGVPIVFEHGLKYDLIELKSMNIDEIQAMYLEKLKENGDNTNYLVLANFDKDESLLAGYLAGLRKGYIIPVYAGDGAGSVLEKINSTIKHLGSRGLFSTSLDYKRGEPLYLAIIGGNASVPYYYFPDLGFEVLNNKDGNMLYSDFVYGDVRNDGYMDLGVGRLDGSLGSVSLGLARERLPVGNKTVLVGEYRHGKFVDMLNGFGGMSQAFMLDEMILDQTETDRIVEKRVDEPRIGGSMNELIEEVSKIAVSESLGMIFGWLWALPSYTDMGISVMYSFFEFDWDPWIAYPGGIPHHLPAIDMSLNDRFGGADVAGYFGVGDKYWLIPKENRSWTEMYFYPYADAANFTSIRFSGFLYDDHDMSLNSDIKSQVIGQGGSVLGSSGIVHDPYAAATSALFFRGIDDGKSLGESYTYMMNSYPDEFGLILLYPSWSLTKMTPQLHLKDISERILFADPAYKPVNVGRKFAAESQAVSVRPSGSFSATEYIESNYTIKNKILTVFNADSYAIEQERPTVPVFVRGFVLPTGASVESVSVDADYSRQTGLERSIVYNDSYYTNYTALIIGCMSSLRIGGEPSQKDEAKIRECIKKKAEPVVKYPYPNESYWYRSHALLDRRMEVDVYVPAVIYENSRIAKVLEDAKIAVEYDSQLEMNVEAENIPLGADETLEITLFNQGSGISGNLYVWVEGGESETWNFTESVAVPGNSSVSREFAFSPRSMGVYQIRTLFDSEGVTVGPRLSSFDIGEVEFILSKSFRPEEVKSSKKKYLPDVNSPEISVENTGHLGITSVKISDSLPKGFAIPQWTSFRKVDVENESFDTDAKMPVFVFIVSGEEKHGKSRGWSWPLKKKISMLDRRYYNASVSGGMLSLATAELAKTNLGGNLGPNERLIVKYLMTGEKSVAPGNLTTQTTATAFSGTAYAERTVTSELKVR